MLARRQHNQDRSQREVQQLREQSEELRRWVGCAGLGCSVGCDGVGWGGGGRWACKRAAQKLLDEGGGDRCKGGDPNVCLSSGRQAAFHQAGKGV